ncbi:hypothetical protein G5C51_14405 [Streptomyces sp. A7024]|uniref:Uncharacterized protein n=1 Tax=Streptomyces coryli TaxID=1128680 RepID=A0A6G4TYW8_9ACTN|nr:hypothetical protein [Streptomyces coryli]NGN65084.1 hypothetical protein [Streptomyces coryli]
MADTTLAAPAAPARPDAAAGSRADAPAAVALGGGVAVSVYPHGGVTVAHLIVLLLLPALLPAARGVRGTGWVPVLLGLWGCAVGFTTLLVGDTFRHFAYAVAQPCTLALSLVAGVWVFRQDRRVIRAFLVALVLGLCAAELLYRSPGFATDPWKFALGPVVTTGAMLCSALLIERVPLPVAMLPAAAASAVSLVTGFRAEFVVSAIAMGLTVLCARRAAGASRLRLVVACGVLAALAAGLSYGYNTLAADGTLGEEQRHRWVLQSDVEGGLLIGARPELVGSVGLIAESPLLGRGVSPEVDGATAAAFLKRLSDQRVPVHEGMVEYYFGRGLYLHSELFQLWAEMGPLAVPGLLAPIVLVFAAALAAVRAASGPRILIFSYLACQFAWDLLFSPAPRLMGTYLGTAAAAAVVYLATLRKGRTGT